MPKEIDESLPDEFAEKIISALEGKNVNLPCPRCGGNDFHLADGLILHVMQSSVSDPRLYGRGFICVGVICDNCGYCAEHSLGSLGLLEEAEKYVDKTAGR